jgi:hypothetical protein
MCKLPKVVVLAPSERHADLRRALSSLEYEVIAVAGMDELGGITADVVLLWEPDADEIASAREREVKVVSVGGAAEGADMHLEPDEIRSFRERIWELFRP